MVLLVSGVLGNRKTARELVVANETQAGKLNSTSTRDSTRVSNRPGLLREPGRRLTATEPHVDPGQHPGLKPRRALARALPAADSAQNRLDPGQHPGLKPHRTLAGDLAAAEPLGGP